MQSSQACNNELSKHRKSTKNSSNSMKDSIFPSELIAEILTRVPVKSLLKFRCVSKSWLALISSPEFVKTHLSLSVKNKDYTHHRLMLREIGKMSGHRNMQVVLRDYSVSSLRNDSVIEAIDLDYPLNELKHSVYVVGSVNGLVCLAIDDDTLFIWNPSIRKFKNLPNSRLKGSDSYDCAAYVIFGFGYDESSDDYKVVAVLCVRRRYDFHHHEVKMYSLKSDSWTSVDDIPNGVSLRTQCIYLNGKLHWPVESVESNGGFHENRNIISMDLADEKWGMLEQPLYTGENFSVSLEVVGSDLSMLCNYMESYADVWVMREYGVKESWTKTYTVKYPDNAIPPFISRTLCMSNKGEILLVPGLIVMAHNPEDEPIKYPNVTNFGYRTDVNFYIESLVCPLLQNEQSTEQE